MKFTEKMLGLLNIGEDYDSQVAALVKKNDALDDAMSKEHEANGGSPKFYAIRVQGIKNSIAIAKLHADESKKDLAAAKKKKAAKSVIWKFEGAIEYHEERIKKLADDMKYWEERAKAKPAKKSEAKVNEAGDIKTLAIQMKVSDTFFADMLDATGKSVFAYEGYVPDFFPDEHYGDYLYLDIDIKTGKITNWKVPTPKDIESMKGENRNKDAQPEDTETEQRIAREDVVVGEVVNAKSDKGDASLLILSKSSTGGFYCVALKAGKIPSEPNVESSNSYLGDKFYRTSDKVKGKVVKFKNYAWFETGNKKVDTKMSQLGDMYKVFSEEATSEAQAVFDKLEDNNYHTENSQFVFDVVKAIIAKKDISKIVSKYKLIADEL